MGREGKNETVLWTIECGGAKKAEIKIEFMKFMLILERNRVLKAAICVK
jgi:hypothetical protein